MSRNVRWGIFRIAFWRPALASLLLVNAPAVAQQTDIHGPFGSGAFGTAVAVLSNGNIVVTDPNGPASNVGAVYMYSPSGALISTLTGSTANDQVGAGGIVVLGNGNFLIVSPVWNNGVIPQVGAVTWGDGSIGVSGVVSSANSLIGSTAGDTVGSDGVTVLSNGNYVIHSPNWSNGPASGAGAATWGSGSSATVGVVSASNSLIGTTAGDAVGWFVKALSNGNYVVRTPDWHNGGAAEAGAVTWGNGSIGVAGVVSGANSLIGTIANDLVGIDVVTLSNGSYVVSSPLWHNVDAVEVGAATWGNGNTGVAGQVSNANSLIGTTASDQVGWTVEALGNGNYVVRNPSWDNGGAVDAGAVTWGNGSTGTVGEVSGLNSLVGTVEGDAVGIGVLTVLSNGNYIVSSPSWHNGGAAEAGAATWGNGSTGIVGAVSIANSLVGATAGDQVASSGATALSNGNFVIRSPNWNNGSALHVGAVTWGEGGSGTFGAVSASNSLIGTGNDDQVGNSGVTALSNGNYVVASSVWDNGTTVDVGAATWGNGSTGTVGEVSVVNSLFGTTVGDQVAGAGVKALSNGNYVVRSPSWHKGGAAGAGAATWGNGSSGTVGVVSVANSVIGSVAAEQVGLSVVALSNGNYLVADYVWDNGVEADAGSVTWGNGNAGVAGAATASNSLVGTAASDRVGYTVTALGNGHYVVRSPYVNGSKGAISLGRGSGGTIGPILATNSVRGTAFGGGFLMVYVYDVARDTLVVGQPAANIVSLFKADLLFTSGFANTVPDL